ncbi:MAG: sedoheptulokinase [Candidatus Brachytrichaceae bacterium NZ_4S206]|jgi:sugar (pentulose or hexulose) kinase
MLSLGLDIGTTTIAAVVFDTEAAQVVAHATASNDAGCTPADRRTEGWAELDLVRVFALALDVLERAIRPLDRRADQVRTIGVTGQMHGAVFLGHDLSPVHPAITWQDQRTRDLIPEFIARAGGAGAFANMGCLPAAGYLGPTLYWLHRHDALPDGYVCGIPEAVAAMLTAQPPVSDPTLAASTGLFDILHGRWDESLLRALDLPAHILPPVVEPGVRVGELRNDLAQRLGLPGGVIIGAALGDHQASLIGSQCDAPGQLHINIGTSGQVSLVVERFTPSMPEQGIETRPFPGRRFILTGAALCGGEALALLRRFFADALITFGARPPDDDVMFTAMIAAAARIPPGTDGLRIHPTFDGVRHRPGDSAECTGLRRANFTPAHVTRAMIEGVADELGVFYDAMREAGFAGRSLAGAGNALRRNALLREAVEQRIGLPLHLPPWEEEAAAGAAILAARLNL